MEKVKTPYQELNDIIASLATIEAWVIELRDKEQAVLDGLSNAKTEAGRLTDENIAQLVISRFAVDDAKDRLTGVKQFMRLRTKIQTQRRKKKKL